MKKKIIVGLSILTGAILSCSVFFIFKIQKEEKWAQHESALYFAKLASLKKTEKWEEIVALGEEALTAHHQTPFLSKEQEFEVIHHLISTYFRLGNFERAKIYAKSLLHLGEKLHQPALVASSFYQFSAVIRAEAGNVDSIEIQDQLFQEARYYAQMALTLCNSECPNHHALKARILFNAGAVECDDPKGDFSNGLAMYREALSFFSDLSEDDYYQRTLIRLGRAYLLLGDLDRSWSVIEEFKSLQPEERTHMHLYYLKAQILKAKNLDVDAFEATRKGMELATRLKAKADLQRFEKLMDSLYKS